MMGLKLSHVSNMGPWCLYIVNAMENTGPRWNEISAYGYQCPWLFLMTKYFAAVNIQAIHNSVCALQAIISENVINYGKMYHGVLV